VKTPRIRVHVVFEHGKDGEPFGSAYVRLLRPLTHPVVESTLDVTFDTDYDGQPVDIVVLDRLWCPDVDASKVELLAASAHRSGARLIHALDDNFPDLLAERPGWATADQAAALEVLLDSADGLLVTTEPLAQRLRTVQSNIAVVPNALDERLLKTARWRRELRLRIPLRRGPVVIGYMGTYTHDDDLRMIAPALRATLREFGDRVLLQFLGVVGGAQTYETLSGMAVHVVHPEPEQSVYPAFLPWFCNTFKWDIAVSPLRDTDFNACKSDIKFLDYAAVGAAGVYSRVPAYAATVRHGSTGWLVGDDVLAWQAALTTLVADAAVRRRTARAASEYLYGERTLAHTATRWVAALQALLAREPAGRAASGSSATNELEHDTAGRSASAAAAADELERKTAGRSASTAAAADDDGLPE
jgi:glycosyltransferase involved in cell wall biosynthesis